MITVKLDAFEGPFDLLFHLIEKNQMNIYDIPIAELTDQYIAHIRDAPISDMDSMSLFLYMAATLLEIKSKMLLPLPQKEENDNSENSVDPREELVARLIEYKMFKNTTEFFKDKEIFGGRFVYRNEQATLSSLIPLQPSATTSELLGTITLDELFRLFQDILRRRELKTDKIRSGFDSVQKDTFTIQEKIDFIKELLSRRQSLFFTEIFGASAGKTEKVVTFLAMLELIKSKEIRAEQENTFDDIILYCGGTK